MKAACKVNLEKLKQRQLGQGGQPRPQRVNQVQDGHTADGGSGGLEEDDILRILGINSINEGIHQGFRTRVAKGGLAARNQW